MDNTAKIASMKTPTLYDLALRSVVMNLYEKSNLPYLTAEVSYKKRNKNQIRLTTEEIEEEHKTKLQSALEMIEESLMKPNYLPFRIKIKLLAAIVGLNDEITIIMEDMATGLRKCLKRNINYCISKILLSENGGVDVRKTILNIIKDSQFKVAFRPKFLVKYCVQKSDVRPMYNDVLKEIRKKVSARKRKCKNNGVPAMIKELRAFMNSLENCFNSWERMARIYLLHPQGIRMCVLRFTQYIAVAGNADVLKFFFKNLKISEPTIHRNRQQILILAAETVITSGTINEEKIIFFYENLQPNLWTELLQKYFTSILLSLLGSWRYRYLCPQFFNEIIVGQDVEKLKNLFNRIADLCLKQRFEYYDIISIILSLWFQLPQDFKEDIETRQVLIPGLILPRADFETLIHFLRSYRIETQKEILVQIVFGLVATGRKGLIQKCLETAKHWNLQISDCKELIDKDSFKKFLIINAKNNRNSPWNSSNLDSVTDLLCSSESEKLNLKKELFSDFTFLVELANMSTKEFFDNILLWGLGDVSSVNIVKKKLLEDELIHEVNHKKADGE